MTKYQHISSCPYDLLGKNKGMVTKALFANKDFLSVIYSLKSVAAVSDPIQPLIDPSIASVLSFDCGDMPKIPQPSDSNLKVNDSTLKIKVKTESLCEDGMYHFKCANACPMQQILVWKLD